MKKAVFYSMIRKNDENVAEMHEGYTDGTYNYYKSQSCGWYAIHPETGLSICCESTRKEAAEKAHDPHIKEKISNALNRMGTIMYENFKNAINAAKEAV